MTDTQAFIRDDHLGLSEKTFSFKICLSLKDLNEWFSEAYVWINLHPQDKEILVSKNTET